MAGVGAGEVSGFGGWVEDLGERGGVDGEVVDGFVAGDAGGGGGVGGCRHHGEDGGLVGTGEFVALWKERR